MQGVSPFWSLQAFELTLVQLEVRSQTGQWCRSDVLAMALLGGTPATCPSADVTLKTHLLHSKRLAAN